MEQLIAVLTDPMVGGLIVTLAGLMVGDLATGVGAAIRRSEFQPLFFAEFLRSHVLGRLMPIVALILLATFAQPLVAVVALAVTAYTVETIASIKGNLDLARDTGEVREFIEF